MIERGGRARFLLESAQPIGVGCDCGGQDLDRDVAAQPRVVRAIDLAHAPGTDGAEDFVGAKARAWLEGHAGSGATVAERSANAAVPRCQPHARLGARSRGHKCYNVLHADQAGRRA